MNINRAAQVDRRTHVPLQQQQTVQPPDDPSTETPTDINSPLPSIIKTEDTPTTEGVRHDPSPEGTPVAEGEPCRTPTDHESSGVRRSKLTTAGKRQTARYTDV
jgi:hypothetical protein